MGKAAERDGHLYRPRGCDACNHTGFRGRIAVLELLVPTEDAIRLVLKRAEARDIDRAARDAGMRSMAEDGFAKARAGLTTIEEVLRVTAEA
jgi:general secretion pathway protein E